MKTRAFLTITFLLLFLLLPLLILWFEAPTFVAPSTPSPTPAVASPSGTETPTPTPTLGEKITQIEKDVFDPIVAALNFAAAVLIAILVLFLLWRIWHLSSHSNLVIDPFNNATGDETLEKALSGFNQLTRERLEQELKEVREDFNKYKAPDLDPLQPSPVPESASDAQLTDLLKSLTEVASGVEKIVVQLLNLIFLPRGSRVTAALQSLGDMPPRLGISLQVVDLEGIQYPTFCTFWEVNSVSRDSNLQTAHASTGGNNLQPAAGPRVSTTPLPRQQAQAYYNVGEQLHMLGLYEEAIHYFEEALKLDKAFYEAAKKLSASVSYLQAQKSAASAYTIGKQLQDAGLVLAAIESYKKPLPTIDDQTTAERAWKAILKLTNGSQAEAYLMLAELYRKDQVFLFDQSLNLYKEAVAQGSQAAARALEHIQYTDATRLTKAARLLIDLAQYDAAEKYLKDALAKVPEDPQAQAALARLHVSKPLEENKDALACYTLGQIYEQRRALDQAKTQYEDALKKQPDYAAAKDALKRILEKRKTLEERYDELMDPAIYWLAIELARRALEDDARRIGHRFRRSILEGGEQSIHYLAQLYNFIGYFHQNGGQSWEQFPEFYGMAIEDFNKAISSDGNWFQPYENRALTYVMRVLRKADKKKLLALSDDSKNDLYKASADYDLAIKLFQKYALESFVPREKEDEAKRRLEVGRSTVQLMLGNLAEAIDKMKAIREGWDLKMERSSRLLYNFASWYGLADNLPDDQKEVVANSVPSNERKTFIDARRAARRYVIYSLAREPGLWDGASTDPNFTSISTKEGWDNLKGALLRREYEYKEPKLSEMIGYPFDEVITEIMREINWA